MEGAVGGLLDELVVVAVVHDPGEPAVDDVGVGEALALLALDVILGDADIAGFAHGTLVGIDASDLDVELWATVATTYYNRLAREGSEGFEDLLAQLLEGCTVMERGCQCQTWWLWLNVRTLRA